MRYERRRRSGQWKVLLISFGIVLLLGTGLFLLGMYLTSESHTADQENSEETITEEVESVEEDPVDTVITESETIEEDRVEISPEEASEPISEPSPTGQVELADPEESGREPIVIVRPELEDMRGFLPEGGRFVRYWWSNMNANAYDEVLIGYILDGGAQVMVVGVEDDTVGYSVLWDITLPGAGIESLRSQRQQGRFVIAAVTGAGTKYLSLYNYDDEAPTPIDFSGGKADGAVGTVTYLTTSSALVTGQIVDAVYEAGRVDIYYGPALGNVASGNYTLNQDVYQLADGEFAFQSTTTALYSNGVRQN